MALPNSPKATSMFYITTNVPGTNIAWNHYSILVQTLELNQDPLTVQCDFTTRAIPIAGKVTEHLL